MTKVRRLKATKIYSQPPRSCVFLWFPLKFVKFTRLMLMNSNWMLVCYWVPTYDVCFQVQLRFSAPRTYHQLYGFSPQAPSQVPRRMLLLGLLVVCLSAPIKTLLTKQVPWQNRTTCLLTSVVCSAYTLSLVLNLLKDLFHVTLKNLDPKVFR